MHRYYSVKNAAHLLGVSTNTIYKYVKNGKLETRRLGKGKIRILKASVDLYVSDTNLITATKYIKKHNNIPANDTESFQGITQHELQPSYEAPRSEDRAIFSPLLRLPTDKAGREQNLAPQAEISSHSSASLRSQFSAKGDKLHDEPAIENDSSRAIQYPQQIDQHRHLNIEAEPVKSINQSPIDQSASSDQNLKPKFFVRPIGEARESSETLSEEHAKERADSLVFNENLPKTGDSITNNKERQANYYSFVQEANNANKSMSKSSKFDNIDGSLLIKGLLLSGIGEIYLLADVIRQPGSFILNPTTLFSVLLPFVTVVTGIVLLVASVTRGSHSRSTGINLIVLPVLFIQILFSNIQVLQITVLVLIFVLTLLVVDLLDDRVSYVPKLLTPTLMGYGLVLGTLVGALLGQ